MRLRLSRLLQVFVTVNRGYTEGYWFTIRFHVRALDRRIAKDPWD